MNDPDCICKGNWRLIVRDAAPFLNKTFRRPGDGSEFVFFGVVHGDDDYYYGMWGKEHGLVLRSCVGPLIEPDWVPVEDGS